MNPRGREFFPRMFRRRGLRAAIAVAGSACMLACPAPRGGWDLAKLVAEEPRIAALGEQRIGDLIPYPVPVSGGFELVSCRWASEAPIRVRLHVAGERLTWAQRAIESLSAGTPSIELVAETVVPDAEPGLAASKAIDVFDIDPGETEHPAGVGDTLVACDVSSRAEPTFGTPVLAEIRMRSAVLDQLDELVPVDAEDWTGALMHELGHALGFQGHLRAGASILVRDQSVLRRAGRDALAGRPWRDETLEALYRLEPGRVLGRRSLSVESRRWVRAAEGRVDQVDQKGARVVGPLAKVGDRHAELEWSQEEGDVLRLHLPFWSRQLRAGDTIVAFPGTKTRAALTARRSPEAR